MKSRMFRYEGSSMWPCFQDGDLLEWEEVDTDQLRTGDCIAYRSTDGRLAVHRIAGKKGGLITRGDALSGRDEHPVRADQVIGRILLRHRLGRADAVLGGGRGRLAGFCYRHAGRLDPGRPSRGGRLARGIRTISTALLKILRCHGVARSMTTGKEAVLVWEINGRVIGRRKVGDAAWYVPWPWTLFFTVQGGECRSETVFISRRFR